MLWIGQIGGTGIDVGGSGRFGVLEHVCDGAVGGELADGVRVFGEGNVLKYSVGDVMSSCRSLKSFTQIIQSTHSINSF